MGVEVGRGPAVPQNTLELCAAAVNLCVHCPEHIQCIRKEPFSEAADVDVIPDALATKEGEVELHTLDRQK